MQKSVAHEQKAVVVLQSWLRKTLSSDSKNVGIYKGNPMNKNILAIAIAAAVAAPSAFAAATVYGVAHMSVDAVQKAANGTDNGDVTNIASNSSRLGIKGSEDLGAGLKAVYQFETTLNLDGEGDAAKGQGSGFGGQRNSYAGLAGGFGTVLLGIHDTPFKLVGRKYDMFGDQIGDMRNLTAGAGASTTGFDLRPSNVVAYASPTFGGVSAMLAYAADERNSTVNTNASKLEAYSASVGYKAGKFGADLAYENHAKGHTGDASKEMTGVRLGASYDFGSVKLNGFYANQDAYVAANAAGDRIKSRNVYGLGASMKVTAAGTIKAQFGMAEKVSGTDSSGANMYAVGYDHAMSKNTTVYAAYAMVDNEANGTYTVNGGGGHGDASTVNMGKDPSAFSVGLIHKF